LSSAPIFVAGYDVHVLSFSFHRFRVIVPSSIELFKIHDFSILNVRTMFSILFSSRFTKVISKYL